MCTILFGNVFAMIRYCVSSILGEVFGRVAVCCWSVLSSDMHKDQQYLDASIYVPSKFRSVSANIDQFWPHIFRPVPATLGEGAAKKREPTIVVWNYFSAVDPRLSKNLDRIETKSPDLKLTSIIIMVNQVVQWCKTQKYFCLPFAGVAKDDQKTACRHPAGLDGSSAQPSWWDRVAVTAAVILCLAIRIMQTKHVETMVRHITPKNSKKPFGL